MERILYPMHKADPGWEKNLRYKLLWKKNYRQIMHRSAKPNKQEIIEAKGTADETLFVAANMPLKAAEIKHKFASKSPFEISFFCEQGRRSKTEINFKYKYRGNTLSVVRGKAVGKQVAELPREEKQADKYHRQHAYVHNLLLNWRELGEKQQLSYIKINGIMQSTNKTKNESYFYHRLLEQEYETNKKLEQSLKSINDETRIKKAKILKSLHYLMELESRIDIIVEATKQKNKETQRLREEIREKLVDFKELKYVEMTLKERLENINEKYVILNKLQKENEYMELEINQIKMNTKQKLNETIVLSAESIIELQLVEKQTETQLKMLQEIAALEQIHAYYQQTYCNRYPRLRIILKDVMHMALHALWPVIPAPRTSYSRITSSPLPSLKRLFKKS